MKDRWTPRWKRCTGKVCGEGRELPCPLQTCSFSTPLLVHHPEVPWTPQAWLIINSISSPSPFSRELWGMVVVTGGRGRIRLKIPSFSSWLVISSEQPSSWSHPVISLEQKTLLPPERVQWFQEPNVKNPGQRPTYVFFLLFYSQLRGITGISLWFWRKQWQPTPVLLPGKSHGWRSLVGCSPWGR